MNAQRATAIRFHACDRKKRYSRPTARDIARNAGDQGVRAYRCPFAGEKPHWHVGHVPSIESLEELAAAVRFFATGYEGH